MNSARSHGYPDGSVVLATGSRTNAAGAFVGGGVGNKAIRGIFGLDGLAIADLESIEMIWRNVIGPAGPNYSPPEPVTTVTPYINLIVDFDPMGIGDIRVVVLLSDQQNPAVSAALGTYSNTANTLTYAWDGTADGVSIVNAPPDPVPGGVAPIVNVGPLWLDRAYAWADLVAANPNAVLVDAYPGDGGYPAGTIMPAMTVNSGDSGALIKSGKQLLSLSVNGVEFIGPSA